MKEYKVLVRVIAKDEEDMKSRLDYDDDDIEWWCCCGEIK
jgi:hypothetical protein